MLPLTGERAGAVSRFPRADGGSISQEFDPDSIAGNEFVSLNGFGSITEFMIGGGNGFGFANIGFVDNLDLGEATVIPLPPPAVLLLFGLFGLASTRLLKSQRT